MAETLSRALAELVRKAEVEPDMDVLREGVRVLSQALLELEVAQHLGAERPARTPERTGQRNGYRERQWDTRVGTIALQVPRVRDGSFYPALLEPRKRAERALVGVIREAYVQGVSTCRVDDLVKALGLDGLSKSQVSLLCRELDAEVERFRTRKLEGTYPYLWVDATFLKVRDGGRVVSRAVVIAVGVNAEGQREILGVDVGPSEDGAFWLAFLRSLVARGLRGVQLVTSDSHQGLKAAIAAVLHGAGWQRCRMHFVPAQSPDGVVGRWRGTQRQHVLDLQRSVSDNNSLDHQLQQRLLFLERGSGQAPLDARTKLLQVGQHPLGTSLLEA